MHLLVPTPDGNVSLQKGSLECLKGAIKGIANKLHDFLMATASADSVEDQPVLCLGVTMKPSEDGKYQNKLVDKTVGTKPKWHIKELPVPTGPVDVCLRALKGRKTYTEELQVNLYYSI